MGLISVDTSSFDELAARLNAAKETLAAAVIAKRNEAVEGVADTMRARAEEFSEKVAAGIEVVPIDEDTTVIRSSSLLGRLNEQGNKGGSPGGGTWRHPVFGNTDIWVAQRKHPFFRSTFLATQEKVRDVMVEALEALVREVQA